MEIQVLGSGSTGNCYRISDGQTNILLDCGLPLKRIKEGLGFRLSSIDGCLVTHEHLDHIRGLDGLKKCGIDIYLSRGTKETLSFNLGHRENIVRPKELFKIGSFQILPFDVQHDAKEPLGFLVQSILTQEKLLYATDTYYLKYKFSGLNYLLIECNYILEILESNLKSGATPLTVRDRLIESHFSLANLKEFFKANDLSKVKEIWLIHMSQSNCDENRAKREIQELTGKPVYIA